MLFNQNSFLCINPLGGWKEPNNYGGNEDCSMMFWWGHKSRGTWADVGCETKASLNRKLIPLCEKDEGRFKQYLKGTWIFSYTITNPL